MEEDNKVLVFLRKHWSKCFLGILAVACVFAWSERFMKSGERKNTQDFFLISQLFNKFQNGEQLQQEALDSAEKILKRHPELHPKYDSMLALNFLAQTNQEKASVYAHSILKKVDSELPFFYKEYAHTTLLVSEGKLKEALTASLALHEQLQGQAGYQTLDAMNTLRLFLLADQLGNQEQKNAYWKKLESHPGFPAIVAVLSEGKVSLSEYLRSRM